MKIYLYEATLKVEHSDSWERSLLFLAQYNVCSVDPLDAEKDRDRILKSIVDLEDDEFSDVSMYATSEHLTIELQERNYTPAVLLPAKEVL